MTRGIVTPEERPSRLAHQMQTAFEQLSLPSQHAVIIGGAVLQLYGLRKAQDLDVMISHELYDFIDRHRVFNKEKRGYYRWSRGFYKPVNVDRLYIDQSDLKYHERIKIRSYLTTGFTDDVYPLSFEDALSSVEPVLDQPTLSLLKVREWKASVGRPRDIADIALIDGRDER